MEAAMIIGKDEQLRARQDLLEAMTSGMSGPVCAPMPGVMLEMLELAAMQRRESQAARTVAPPHLTQNANGSRIRSEKLRVSRAFADVASRIAGYIGPWRLPA
jgi:hypothetical protein